MAANNSSVADMFPPLTVYCNMPLVVGFVVGSVYWASYTGSVPAAEVLYIRGFPARQICWLHGVYVIFDDLGALMAAIPVLTYLT